MTLPFYVRRHAPKCINQANKLPPGARACDILEQALLRQGGTHMPSFDIVSRVDMQEIDNAANQVKKEITTRFDFRGSKTEIELDRKEAKINLLTEDDMKLHAIRDMLIAKVVRRSIDVGALDFGTPEKAGGDMLKQAVTIVNGIDIETARKVVKLVKDTKIRVQAAIQGEEVRITGKKRDDLQDVINALKEADVGMPLQFVNFRE